MIKFSTLGKIGIAIGILGGLIGLAVGIMAAPGPGIIMALIFAVVFGGVFWGVFKPMIDANNIVKNGKPGQATILKLWDTGVTLNENPQIGLLLEVTPANGGPTFQAQVKTVISRLQTATFQPGATLPVKYDPDNKTKVAIDFMSSNTTDQARVMTDMLQKIENENQDIMSMGREAKAKVLKYTPMDINVNGNNPAVELFLEVRPDNGPKFDATARGVVGEAAVAKFQVGKEVYVKYDPNDLTRVTVTHS